MLILFAIVIVLEDGGGTKTSTHPKGVFKTEQRQLKYYSSEATVKSRVKDVAASLGCHSASKWSKLDRRNFIREGIYKSVDFFCLYNNKNVLRLATGYCFVNLRSKRKLKSNIKQYILQRVNEILIFTDILNFFFLKVPPIISIVGDPKSKRVKITGLAIDFAEYLAQHLNLT